MTLLLYDNKEIIVYAQEERIPLYLKALRDNPSYTSMILSSNDLVAFFSASCPHCYHIGKQLAYGHQMGPKFKMLTFVNGDTLEVARFMKETGLPQNNSFILNGEEFKKRVGTKVPAIFLVQNDTAYSKIRYISTYQISTIQAWLRKHP